MSATYGASLAKTSETILETATLQGLARSWCLPQSSVVLWEINLLVWLTELLFGRVPGIWLAARYVLFSLLVYMVVTVCGRVGVSVVPLFVFWIIFLLDLELGFMGGLLVFRWELTVLLLLQICFFFVMRGISWSLSHVKIGVTFNFKIPWWFVKCWQYLLWPDGGPDMPYRAPVGLREFFRCRGAWSGFESMYVWWCSFHRSL